MTTCDVCNDFKLLQKATCDEKAFRWNILKSLCYIIESLESNEVTPVPSAVTIVLSQVIKTYSQIETGFATYTTIGLVDTTKKLNYLRVVNNTDADLQFSFDGGVTTAFNVVAGTIYERNLNLTLEATTSLHMRKVSGQTAGVGSVYIEGDYEL